MNMKLFALLLSVGYLVAHPVLANEEVTGCKLEEYLLVCAGGSKKRSDIAASFGHAETVEQLNEAIANKNPFATPLQREKFRRSLERAHKALRAHTKKVYRDYRSKRISDEERGAAEEVLAQGMQSYERGLYLYRNHIWQSEKPSRYSEAPDLEELEGPES